MDRISYRPGMWESVSAPWLLVSDLVSDLVSLFTLKSPWPRPLQASPLSRAIVGFQRDGQLSTSRAAVIIYILWTTAEYHVCR